MAEEDSPFDVYVLDSSGWISIDGRPDHAKILWHVMQLIEGGRIKSPPEVWRELKRCHNVLAWIKEHRKKIVLSISDGEYLKKVGEIAHRYPQMCATRGSREKADGYVVAMTFHLNRTTNRRHRVVAAETAVNRPMRKIPTVCSVYALDCEGLFDMLRREFPNEVWKD